MSYSKYPGAVDDNESMPETVDLVTELKAEVVNRLRDGIIATETTIGANPTDGYATIKDRLDAMQTEIDAGGGVSAHAPTHEEGGSDEIAIQNLGSAGAAADKVLVTDGAGGLTLQDYIGGGGGSFTAGGDLTGDDTEQTVSFIQGISTPDPADADVDRLPQLTEGTAPTFTNPRHAVSDGTNIWIAEQDTAEVYVFNATSRRFVAQYDYSSLYTPAFGGAIRTINVDSNYAYITTFADNHVLIVNKGDGSVAGWAYTQDRAISTALDGSGNLFVNVGTGTTAPNGIQKFSIAGCIGQPRSTKTYDAILSGTGGLDGAPRRIIYGGGFIWACVRWVNTNLIFKIDPVTLTIFAANDDDGLAGGTQGYDLVYAFGYVWVTTLFDASVLQYDPTTLSALSNTAIPTVEDAAGIAVGPDTAGNPNARLWVTDLDPGTAPVPNIYAINPTGPAYDTLINLGAAATRATDNLVGTNTHLWIPTFDWASTTGVMVVDPTTGTDDGVLGALGLEYRSLTLEGRGTEDGQSRRAISPYGFMSSQLGSWTVGGTAIRPRGCIFTGDGIFMADSFTNSIWKFDFAANSWGESVGYGNNTIVGQDLHTNFAPIELDTTTLTPSCSGPVDMAFDGRNVWCIFSTTQNVCRIESFNNTPADPEPSRVHPNFLDSFPAGGLGHTPVRIVYDGVNMFICGGTTLSKYDRGSGVEGLGTLSQLSVFTDLVNMIFDGLYLWVLDDGTDQLIKVNGETMQVVATVDLSGDSSLLGTNKLAFDGSSIYVSRSTPGSLLDIVHVDTHEITTVTLSKTGWTNGGDIVFDGRMIKLFWNSTFPSSYTVHVECFDPTTKRELGAPGSGMYIVGPSLDRVTRAEAIGPGFIVAWDDINTSAVDVYYVLTADPPRYARTHFFGTNYNTGQSGSFTRGIKMSNPSVPNIGVEVIDLTGRGGITSIQKNIWLQPHQVNCEIIQLTGAPIGDIDINYNGSAPGAKIIHNRIDWAGLGYTLTVSMLGQTLTLSPQPGVGDSVMFYVDLEVNAAGTEIHQLTFV